MILLSSLVLVGCSSDKHPKITSPDASQPIDAPPPPPGCDYGELQDKTNDTLSPQATGISEDTGLTDGIGKVFCGNVDMDHFDTTNQTIDIDSYQFTLAADGAIRVDLVGTGLEALDEVDVFVTDGAGQNLNVDGDGVFFTNHAVTIAGLPAGTYSVAMGAYATAAPTSTAALPYKIKVTAFDAGSCAAATGAATHTEGATDNDVLTVKYGTGGFRHMTTKTTDAAEASGITLTPGTNVSISGSIDAAGTALDGDDYLDRDTFELATDAMTNEVLVRLDWTQKMSDLDFYFLPKLTAPPTNNWFYLTAGTTDSGVGAMGMGGPELAITAIDPSQPWWVWAGGYTGSTGLPSAYTITVCPKSFTP